MPVILPPGAEKNWLPPNPTGMSMFPRIPAELFTTYPVASQDEPGLIQRLGGDPTTRNGDYMSAIIAALACGGTAKSIAAMMQITAIKRGMRSRSIGPRLNLDRWTWSESLGA
jgi:hypothetical protein